MRAQERIRAEQERERARREAEWEVEEAERRVLLEGQRQAMLEAGPPGGCGECWSLEDSMFGLRWFHGDSAEPGPPPDDWDISDRPSDWCWHACHGEDAPAFCGPIAVASAG